MAPSGSWPAPTPRRPLQSPSGPGHSYPEPAVHQGQRTEQHEKERRPEPQADRQRREPGGNPDRGQDAGEDSPSGSQVGVRRHGPSGTPCRLEQLDGISRGILEEDLIAPDPSNQVAPKANTGSTQRVDHRAEVGDLQLEA